MKTQQSRIVSCGEKRLKSAKFQLITVFRLHFRHFLKIIIGFPCIVCCFPPQAFFVFFQPSTARLENDKLNRHTYDNLRHLFEIDYAFSILQLPVYSSIEHDKTKHNKLLLKFGSLLSDDTTQLRAI